MTAYGPSLTLRGGGVEPLANPGQPAVFAVAHRDHEVESDEDHDLAGLDDLAGQRDRLVLDVVDGLEHQKQRLVVALEFRPLMRVHGVLDGQLVQAEHVGHRLHLVLVGFMQADPDERVLAFAFQLVHLVQRGGVGVLAGQALARRSRCRSRPSPARRGRGWTRRPGRCAWRGRLVASDGGNARNVGIGSPPGRAVRRS